tara:strand:- start:795 stop:1508 length:714 start_codon:yes stop_codon:yes gene_type:complete
VIEKNVFQTWKTQKLPKKIEKVIDKNKNLNQEYTFTIYTDEQIHDFIKSNYSGEISNSFEKLKHPVAKADFWRYLVVYKYGGCYLDIDSKFINPIDKFIKKDDEALISAEQNPGNYIQWALFFKKEHPILMRTVELIVDNIEKGLYKNDIEKLTGPKIYAKSIEEFFINSQDTNLVWENIDENTNLTFEFNFNNTTHSARIYGIDYANNLQFKHKYSHLLYEDKEHWLKGQEKESVY